MATWIERIVVAITGFIAALGYFGVFAGMALESACIPIPSEVTLLFSGFLVGEGRFKLWPTIGSALGGALVGSTISYLAGRYGGKPFLTRYGKFVLLTETRMVAVESWFGRYGDKAVLYLRWVTGLRALVSLPAGIVHMRYSRFLLATVIGTGTWVVFGILLGMLVGEKWKQILHLLKSANYLILLVLILGVVALWLVHHRVHKGAQKGGVAAPVNDEQRD